MQGELDTDHILYLKVIRDALIIDFDAKIIVLPPLTNQSGIVLLIIHYYLKPQYNFNKCIKIRPVK